MYLITKALCKVGNCSGIFSTGSQEVKKKKKKAILIQAMERVRKTGDAVQQQCTAFTIILEVDCLKNMFFKLR